MLDKVAVVGVWVPSGDGPPSLPPEQRPIGRAALTLRAEGIDIVFGDRMQAGCMDGFRAIEGGWVPVSGAPIDAIHDRFPSQVRAVRYRDLLAERAGRIMGNPEAFTRLCRDKLLCQTTLVDLDIPMPEVEADPARFHACLDDWGAGFVKPRFGALGAGVARLESGDAVPRTCPGVVPGIDEPAILQRAIDPPAGWAGVAVRVLVQRMANGWHIETPVFRSSRTDPVANAARGASVSAGPAALDQASLARVHNLAHQVTQAFDRMPAAQTAVEAGLDMVIDPDSRPHLIEVNSRPRGRLEVLAQHDPTRFQAAHEAACARPIRMLALWACAHIDP